MMRCLTCKHGQTNPGLVTVTLEREESIAIIKKVPVEVCDNCGEYYSDLAPIPKSAWDSSPRLIAKVL